MFISASKWYCNYKLIKYFKEFLHRLKVISGSFIGPLLDRVLRKVKCRKYIFLVHNTQMAKYMCIKLCCVFVYLWEREFISGMTVEKEQVWWIGTGCVHSVLWATHTSLKCFGVMFLWRIDFGDDIPPPVRRDLWALTLYVEHSDFCRWSLEDSICCLYFSTSDLSIRADYSPQN